MTVRQLRAIVAACPETVAGLRDRVLVLLVFTIAGRRSEVANLLDSDLQRSEYGLVVSVRLGKTGARRVAVPTAGGSPTCPLIAWDTWLAASGTMDGSALRRVDRHGRALGGMRAQAVGDVITRAGERAGVKVRLTGHWVRLDWLPRYGVPGTTPKPSRSRAVGGRPARCCTGTFEKPTSGPTTR